MTIEDLSQYEEVEMNVERWDLVDNGIGVRIPHVHQTQDTHGRVRLHREEHNVRAVMVDAMSREVEAGDILNWRSGGYFGHYLAFGMVTKVDYDSGCIKLINHNKNRITMWQTHRCVILAKANDYSIIPEEYLKLWLPEDE